MTSIFISYSSTDVELGTRLRDLLDARGYAAVFRDKDPEHGIAAGTRWAAELFSNLERADVVVFLASEASLASPWCHTELAVGVARGKHIVQVAQQKVPVHRVLADRQAMAPEPDLDRLVDALIANLSAVGFGPGDEFSWDVDRSPYPGLGRLDRDHAAVLFGRDAEVGACLQRLSGPRPLPLLVSGPSGSGKSSMVRAGVLPRLERQQGTRVLPVVEPGDSPLQRVALAFAMDQGEADAAKMIADPKGLAFAVDRAVAGGATRVVLFLDQAEDLIARADKAQMSDLMTRLQAVDPDRLVVISAVRSMSLDAWLQEPALAWLGQADPVWVRPLGREALREVVVGPAHIAGIRFEPETLVDRIVEDTAQGNALPLLAALLEELAEGHSRLTPAVITAKRYEEIGPVARVIERRATEATSDIRARRGIPESSVIDAFLRLVEVDDEGAVTGADVVLDDVPAEVRDVFEDLDRFRLVTRDQRIVATAAPGDGAATGRSVDVARAVHEEIFRAWPAIASEIRIRRTDLETRTWLRHDAQSWDSEGRGNSNLTGGRLSVARAWRERNPGEVTPVVDDFIRQSRRQDTRRRAVMYAVPVLAVVALAVGVLAFQAYSEAQRANAARSEADALRLAGDARSTLDTRPDLGLLLAMEAAARSDAPQLQGMPLAALTHGPGPRRFEDVGEPVKSAALDSAGSHAVMRTPSQIVLWDVDDGAVAGTLPASSDVVAISGDGSIVALATPDGVAIHPWDSPGDAVSCPVSDATITELVLSDDGAAVAVVSEDSAGSQSLVTLLDPSSCEITSSLTGVPGDVRGVAFDQSGENLALGMEDNGAGVWDVATGEPLTRIGDETETVRALAFGNAETLGWATTDGKLHVTDIADPESSPQEFLVHGGDEIVTLAFSAVDDAFLSGAATGEMRRVKPDGVSPVGPAFRALAPLDYSGESFRPRGLAANGPRGVSVDSAGRVVVWELDGRPPLGPELAGDRVVELVAPSADGSAIASDGEEIWLVDTATGEQRPLAQRRGITALATNEAGWAAGTTDGEILTGGASPESVQTIKTFPGKSVRALAAVPGGAWAAALEADGGGGSVAVLPNDGEAREQAMTATPASLAVGNDRVYVGDMVGTIHAFALNDLHVAEQKEKAHDFDIAAIALSPDGSLLATGSDDRAIALWDVADNGGLTERSRLRGHEERVRSLAFSPDGKWLASAGEEPAVRFWDLDSERPVGDPIDVGPVPVVAFSRTADRQLLVADNGLSAWDMRADQWPAIACRILGTRRLGDAEREQYLGNEPAQAACS